MAVLPRSVMHHFCWTSKQHTSGSPHSKSTEADYSGKTQTNKTVFGIKLILSKRHIFFFLHLTWVLPVPPCQEKNTTWTRAPNASVTNCDLLSCLSQTFPKRKKNLWVFFLDNEWWAVLKSTVNLRKLDHCGDPFAQKVVLGSSALRGWNTTTTSCIIVFLSFQVSLYMCDRDFKSREWLLTFGRSCKSGFLLLFSALLCNLIRQINLRSIKICASSFLWLLINGINITKILQP